MSRSPLLAVMSFVCALASPASGAGPEPRPAAVADIASLREVCDVTIDATGRRVAFTVESTDSATSRPTARIWIASTSGGDSRPFTAGPGRDWSPRFSPDGSALAFLSDRSGRAEIWWMPTGGGEARRLPALPGPALDFAWSPDGSRIAAVACDPDESGAAGSVRPGVRLERADGGHAHLFLVALAGGAVRALTSGAGDDFDPAFAPDGATIVFASNRNADARFPSNADLYAVPASGGPPRVLAATPAMECSPAVSPDGTRVAFLSCTGASGGLDDDSLCTMPLDGGAETNLTAESGVCAGGVHAGDGPCWTADGSTIVFGAREAGDTTIWTLSRDAASPRRLILGPGENGKFAVARSAGLVAFVRSEAGQPPDVWIASLRSPDLRRLTDVNRAELSAIRLASTETLRVREESGAEAEVSLVKPVGLDPSRKCAAALCLSGDGGRSFRAFDPAVQRLAASGYAVLLVPPGPRAGEVAMAALDDAAERGMIDGERVGLVAGPAAADAALDLLASTTRFRAAVLGAGIESTRAPAGRFRVDAAWRPSRVGDGSRADDVAAPVRVVDFDGDDPAWSIAGSALVRSLRSRGIASELSRGRSGDPSVRLDPAIAEWLDAWVRERPSPTAAGQ
jgi:Tol biopolymer transport system component